MTRLPQIRPRTKHVNQSYHFFCEAVERKVSIMATPMENQLADMLSKPPPEETFVHRCETVLGWGAITTLLKRECDNM